MAFQEMGLDDLIRELEEFGQVDRLAPQMLEAAAPILEKEMKNQVRKQADKGYATGDLENAVTHGKTKKNQYGHYLTVTAEGTDRKGVRNNDKLAYLNYGTSKQAARPVISTAVNNSEEACITAMQDKFNEAKK